MRVFICSLIRCFRIPCGASSQGISLGWTTFLRLEFLSSAVSASCSASWYFSMFSEPSSQNLDSCHAILVASLWMVVVDLFLAGLEPFLTRNRILVSRLDGLLEQHIEE